MKKKNVTMEEEIIEEIVEKDYQIAKKMLNKNSDYFSYVELEILMQFLMQHQEKVIKNEEKI